MSELQYHTTSGLELFLIQHRHGEFAWGHNDCNTFIVEYVDLLLGSNIISEVRGKYFNARSALAFIRNYKALDVGLQESGFTIVDTPQNGDIITFLRNGFVCGHIIGFNRVHSIDEQGGYIAVPLDRVDLSHPDLKIWRHNG
jgi:hypothetical protein